jgi:hypothetical protein
VDKTCPLPDKSEKRLIFLPRMRNLNAEAQRNAEGTTDEHGLALALKVSLRTVDLMLADGEITPMRLRGKLVRFYLPDVLQELREKAKTSKRNVARRVTNELSGGWLRRES